VPDLGGLHLVGIEELEAEGTGISELAAIRPESLALLQYTSGSTGRPKGVCITHENLIHNASLVAKAMGLNAKSAGVNWLPLYHDMGLMSGLIAPMLAGYPVTLLSPNGFLAQPLSWFGAICTSPGEHGTRLVSSGCPVEGQRVFIVDPESGVQCSDGQIGEVFISGRSVSRGYWNNHEETSRTFCGRVCDKQPERFLRSGDLGFLFDGNLFIVGRLKDLIIIRGFNHYAEDIEATIDGCHPGLVRGAVAAFSIQSAGTERLVVAGWSEWLGILRICSVEW
jgi:acyl-CoA synthetase (AMP-forming)/AMP-acid ligase II